MKEPTSRHPQYDLFSALQENFDIDPRRLLTLCAFILGIIQTRSVVMWRMIPQIGLPGSENTVYKRLKRFLDYKLSQFLIAQFVLNFLKDEEQLLLILDRTNWKWGKEDINFLILSVSWNGFSLPLAWSVLPHAGNSNTQQRIALLESVLSLLKGKKLFLLADREFIGKEWFQALKRLNISPCIRLRADSRVEGIPIHCLFRKLNKGEVRYWHKRMSVYGCSLRVMATKNPFGQILYLAYEGHASKALEHYACRWHCENMHQALKTRGFNLEDTHVTDTTRISNLLSVVVLAFVWCCLVGEFEASREPSGLLKHGYPPKSLFRRGLDALQKAIQDVAWRKRGARRRFKQLLATFVP